MISDICRLIIICNSLELVITGSSIKELFNSHGGFQEAGAAFSVSLGWQERGEHEKRRLMLVTTGGVGPGLRV